MIKVDAVTKSFGAKTVLQGVSLTVPDGSVTGFVGPNGAGKTTLMKIIVGLLEPQAGTVTVDGRPYAEAPLPARSIGALISAEWLPGRLKAETVLRYACDVNRLPPSRVGELLAEVGLEQVGGQRIKRYSLGMRQRLGLALALVADPHNLILDEPVNGLDPDGVLWLRSFLRHQAGRGKAVFLSSHLMSELELVADDVIMLSEGRVVRQGRVADLTSTSTQTYVESPDVGRLAAVLGAHGFAVAPQGQGLVVTSDDTLEIGRLAFLEGPGVTQLKRITESLENLYRQSTVGEHHAKEL